MTMLTMIFFYYCVLVLSKGRVRIPYPEKSNLKFYIKIKLKTKNKNHPIGSCKKISCCFLKQSQNLFLVQNFAGCIKKFLCCQFHMPDTRYSF